MTCMSLKHLPRSLGQLLILSVPRILISFRTYKVLGKKTPKNKRMVNTDTLELIQSPLLFLLILMVSFNL